MSLKASAMVLFTVAAVTSLIVGVENVFMVRNYDDLVSSDGHAPNIIINANDKTTTYAPNLRGSNSGEEEDDVIVALPTTTSTPLPVTTISSKPVVFDNNDDTDDKPKFEHEFVMYRAIGNDLPPRHALGQTYTNIKFILENEPKHERLTSRWLLNRIINKDEEKRLMQLLMDHNQEFIVVPFEVEEYGNLPLVYEKYSFDSTFTRDIMHSKGFADSPIYSKVIFYDNLYNDKNLYVMNNNGARNLMIKEGLKSGAKWVLPFDGNCYFTPESWSQLLKVVDEKGADYKYFAVPMERMSNNEDLFNPLFTPTAAEEPQIMFRYDSKERFDETLRYGRRPKVELLWRLGVPGPGWDRLKTRDAPAEIHHNWRPSSQIGETACEIGCTPLAGWVARLYSGNSALEQAGTASWTNRARSRTFATEYIMNVLTNMFAEKVKGFSMDQLKIYDEKQLSAERASILSGSASPELRDLVQELLNQAEDSMSRGAYSVYDNGNRQSPAGYFYSPALEHRSSDVTLAPVGGIDNDEGAWVSFRRDVTILTLANYFSDRSEFGNKAATLVKTWFLNAETAMKPSVLYARSNPNSKRFPGDPKKAEMDIGAADSIQALDGLHYVMDAVTLLARGKYLDEMEVGALKTWCESLSNYLEMEGQQNALGMGGSEGYYAPDHVGVYYDLSMVTLASMRNDIPAFYNYTQLARGRLLEQVDASGNLVFEHRKPSTRLHVLYSLHAWLTMTHIGESCTVDYNKFTSSRYTIPELERVVKKELISTIYDSDGNLAEDIMTDNQLEFAYFTASKYFPAVFEGRDDYSKNIYKSQPLIDSYPVQPFWNLGFAQDEQR